MSIHKKKSSPKNIRLIILTALITLVLAGGGAWLLGYLRFGPTEDGPKDTAGTGERRVAYWRAPMNPTEIYDQPGKSAMGMDLVPVYEDELAGSGSGRGGERKIAYWRAPMNPREIYNQPGKSAMGMDLVPVYEDELVGGVEIAVDPVVRQNMGLRTAEVAREPLVMTIRTYGHVVPDETRTVQISPKTSGWIKKLYVDFLGISIEKGQPMYTIYSPELLGAQEEYLGAFRRLDREARGLSRDLLASARRRLFYFDVADREIEELEKSGRVSWNLLIRSPFSGVVIEKNVTEGSYVRTGNTIFKLADLSRVWVEAHIYEYELPWVRQGQAAEMTFLYLPGKVYRGQVSFVYPYLQPRTRDVIVRLEFDNPDLELKPDMFGDVVIRNIDQGEGLVIPAEAVIHSGERDLVFVEREAGKFTPRKVELGLTLDEAKVQVLTGLAAGERIVVSGQFLLDSESNLKESVQKMMEVKNKPAATEEKDDFFDEFEKKDDDFFGDLEKDDGFFNDLEGKKDDFFKDLK